MFIRYPERSKRDLIYSEHPDRGMIEIESCNVEFVKEFSSIGEVKKNIGLYELQ